jgi:hypothetical protein
VIINKLYSYPSLERNTGEDGTRFYLDPNTSQPLPSVTTILSHTADKSFLIEWQNRVGQKKADAIRDEAAGLGTLLHTHMECYIQNIDRPKGNNIVRQLATRMADTIINKGLPKVDEVWGYEVPLYFPGLYAGTTDLVGVYDGKPAIMDYKNTKKMKTKDMIGDYMAQLCAYALAHNENHGTNISCGVIFMVDRSLKYETFVIEGNEFTEHAMKFLNRVDEFYHPKTSF